MIRHPGTFLLCLLFLCLTAEAQVDENFNDGEFTTNPGWLGDTSNWKVIGSQLNSNGAASITHSYLSTHNTLALNTSWEFFINLKFATSSVNYTDIFLISDSANLEGLNSGIFVRIGNTSDEISLYRKDLNTIIKIIDGADGRVASSTNNIFKIKITRTPNNEFYLYDDNTGTGNSYMLEGVAIEPSYSISSWFGIAIKFSSANTQKFFFDDIKVSPIIADTLGPLIDSVWTEDSLECIVKFNESVDSVSAFLVSNYALNGITNPISAKRSMSKTNELVLHFSSAFLSNTINNIQVKNVNDLSGNSMNQTTKTFRYIVLQDGDLVINEIFADPSPSLGLPAYEYIELWNNSTSDINLQGFSFTDGSSTAVFPNYVLAKDSFLIISSTSSSGAYAGYGNSIMLSGFPGLNNDEDNLQLKNKQGNLLDQVHYDLSWYNDNLKSDGGWSLELINPKLTCKKKYNWSASTNSIGGSPGKLNSIYKKFADTIAPIPDLKILNDSSAVIIFNSTMDSSRLLQISITGSLNITNKKIAGQQKDSLLINFLPLINQVNYSIILDSAYSCNGVKIRPKLISFTYDKTFPVKFNGIVFSEILVNPLNNLSLPQSQFAELYNRSNYSINLKGMNITDGVSTATLPDFILMKDSFIILVPSTKLIEFTSRSIHALPLSSFPYLNMGGDILSLLDSNGQMINSMNYDTKILNNDAKAKGGWSLELIDPNNTCLQQGNWNFCIDPAGATPNKENSIHGIVNENTPLRFIRAYNINQNEAVLIFNKGIDLESSKLNHLFDFVPKINSAYTLSYYNNKLSEIHIWFQNNVLLKDSIYIMSIMNFKDCQGKKLDSIAIPFGFPSEPGYKDIAVNEILFNAKSYASEFIEIHNNSEKIFDLNQISLILFSKTGLSNTIVLSDVPLQILPGNYFAVSANSDDIRSRYYSPNPDKIFTNNDWVTLDDDSGTVLIVTTLNSNPIDSVSYSKDWHHPFISNDEGVSLERINYDRDGKGRNNWLSASSASGYATPAYQNSKYSENIVADEFVFLTKTFFTPDNDGVDDELNLTINLPSKNYSLNISIYDIKGNEVKKLARNDIAAVTNYYTWNGANANGGLANTGHYILYIEAVDGDGNIRTSKKTFDLIMK